MNARDTIEAALRGAAGWGDDQRVDDLLVGHRAEVLAKAIGRLRAIPVTCTALTGPVWYGDGWNSAITQLEEIADYQGPDDEDYPGELQRLRATVLALRVAALRQEDLARVQQVLTDHEEWRKKATAAAPTATPDFFEAEHTYRRGVYEFRCLTLTTCPRSGEARAVGLRSRGGWPWDGAALDPDDWEHGGWTDTTNTTGDNT